MTDLGWINRSEYPFDTHFFQTGTGRMNYLDEGNGDPIVFIHGNPSWSFQYRNVIKELSKDHRCIAPDMIGFGLSDKPADFSYLPKEQAKLVEGFLESLDLNNITIVVGDWGGPIGLSYAINHPERIKNIVITNTWLWSVKKDWYYQAFSKFVGGPIGRFLIKRRNFFARDIVKAAYGDKKKLTKEIHQHYLKPIEKRSERKGSWVFPGQVVGSWEWLDSLWEKRSAIKQKKVLIAWGMKDIAFRKKELDRFIELFSEAKILKFPDAGHYIAEEKPGELTSEIRNIMDE